MEDTPNLLLVRVGQVVEFSLPEEYSSGLWQLSTDSGESWMNLSEGSSLKFLVESEDDGNWYRVCLSNQTYLNFTQLQICSSPQIQSRLTDTIVWEGQEVNFKIEMTQSEEYTYQWQKDGQNIEGATQDSYSISSKDSLEEKSGLYTVVVFDGICYNSSSTQLHILPESILKL